MSDDCAQFCRCLLGSPNSKICRCSLKIIVQVLDFFYWIFYCFISLILDILRMFNYIFLGIKSSRYLHYFGFVKLFRFFIIAVSTIYFNKLEVYILIITWKIADFSSKIRKSGFVENISKNTRIFQTSDHLVSWLRPAVKILLLLF